MSTLNSNLPPYYKKHKLLPIAAPRKPNGLWEKYGIPGSVLGGLLSFFAISMIPLEVARIITGSLNRGTQGAYYLYPNYNADANANSQLIKTFENNFQETNLAKKGIVPFSATTALGQTAHNYPIQDQYLWPWSHAALLFSLVSIAAGFIGILSGCRRTYSTIFAFFTLSLLSGFLSIFLIAYYATEVNWQLNANSANRAASEYSNRDYALASAMLSLSCVVTILSFLSALFAGCSAGVCRGAKSPLIKDLSNKKQKKNKSATQPIDQQQQLQQPMYSGYPQPGYY